jgi:hypothetical protein
MSPPNLSYLAVVLKFKREALLDLPADAPALKRSELESSYRVADAQYRRAFFAAMNRSNYANS